MGGFYDALRTRPRSAASKSCYTQRRHHRPFLHSRWYNTPVTLLFCIRLAARLIHLMRHYHRVPVLFRIFEEQGHGPATVQRRIEGTRDRRPCGNGGICNGEGDQWTLVGLVVNVVLVELVCRSNHYNYYDCYNYFNLKINKFYHLFIGILNGIFFKEITVCVQFLMHRWDMDLERHHV